MSPKGSAEFNTQYTTDENVYYFSFTTYATSQRKDAVFHGPDSEMSIHLWPTGLLIGQYSEVPDNMWYENDGVVNSVSMTHPKGSKMLHFTGNPTTGTWQIMEKLNMDHQAVIGHNISDQKHGVLFALYNNHCKLLRLLK